MSECLDTMSEPVLYDIFNANCVDDIEMYKKMCTNVDQVLELGVGTGRLAIPLVQSGVRVVGIDNSPQMLAVLESKIKSQKLNDLSYYEQDMRSLSLKSKFNLILCPFCAFNFLLSAADQEKALFSISELLTKESRIVFDVLTVNTFSDSFQDGSLKHFDSYALPSEEATIEIYTSSKFNQCNQIFSQERIFRKYTRGILIDERHIAMQNRLFFLGEFQLLLDKCGFKIINIYGDYNFAPFSQSSQSLIVVAVLK